MIKWRCKLRAFREQRCVKFQVQGNQMPISPTPIRVAADKREQYSLQREWDVRGRSGRENQQLLCHCASSQTGQPLGDTWREPGCGGGGLDFLISLSHLHVCEAGGVGCFRPLQACLSGSLSGRRCKGREAEPALAHWVLRSPSARRANQLQRCNSRTPFLTTAFSHFALPLTTPVCLS